MSKEAFIESIEKYIIAASDINKDFIVDYLVKNYPSEDYIPEGFDKIAEMGKILSLVEKIMASSVDTLSEENSTEYVKAVVYSTSIIEGRKHKIDIFKVKEDFDIEDLFTKYEI